MLKYNTDQNHKKVKLKHDIMGIPCTRCVSHTGYLTHGNSKSEARGRSRHQNQYKRLV